MSDKNSVLIYTETFLRPSMTFIYNQLIELQTYFNIYVGCNKSRNKELFPYDKIITFPEKRGLSFLFQGMLRRSGIFYIYKNRIFEQSLVEFLIKHRIHLLHVHFGLFAVRVYNATNTCNIPLIVTFHGFDASRYLKNSGYVKAIRTIMGSPHVYGITVSNTMKNKLKDYDIDISRTQCHYIGTDTSFFNKKHVNTSKDNSSFILLQVSNFNEIKGHIYTIEAFYMFLNRITNSSKRPKLILVGDGPSKKKIIRRVKHLGLQQYVSFPGFTDKYMTRKYMAEADVFVHHSVTAKNGGHEGLPTVLMEAMAMELPILSTRHAGIPELVEDGLHGYLVDERDINTYSEKMLALFLNNSLNFQHNRNRILQHFDLKNNSNYLKEYYKEIIGKHKS